MKIRSSIFWVILLISITFILSCSGNPNTPPTGFLDVAKYQDESFYAAGWAADKEDGSPVREVKVYLDGNLVGEAKLGIDRTGVATETKNPKWDKSGWEISVKKELDKGAHTVYAVAMDKNGATSKLHNEIRFDVD